MLAEQLSNGFLVFVRVSAFFAVFPLLSAANFPVRLRIGFAVLLAFMITPGLPPLRSQNITLFHWVGGLAAEIGVGLLLGWISRIVFYGVEFAGALIANELGLNLASTLNPMSQMRSEIPTTVLFYLAGVVMFSLDLHHWLILAVAQSFQVVPLGCGQLTERLFHFVLEKSGSLFVIGVQMAAPFIAAAFLLSLLFSVLGRAVPQMNVFQESFGIRLIAGFAVFGLTLSLLNQQLISYLRQVPDAIGRVLHLLGGG